MTTRLASAAIRAATTSLALVCLLAAPGCREPASVIDHATGMTSCDACHHDRWAATTDPAHATLGYPTDCATCHETSAWSTVSSRPHADPDDWPLTGRHLGVACGACHGEDTWEGLDRACVACHAADYAASTNPDHEAEKLPRTCETCHTPAGWRPALAAAHLASGAFPLTGGHAGRACADCHDPDDYPAVPKTCHGCHADDYAATTNPDHQASNFPTSCQSCHSTTAWKPATATAHLASGAFPLTGGHAGRACADCHDPDDYPAVPKTCHGCHADDYAATTNPDHQASNFPTSCQSCHSTTAWKPATATAHLASGAFPLTGGHAGRACADCHDPDDYPAVPKTCHGCHADDYTATTNPSHGTLGLPTTCSTCHTTTAWSPADFESHHTMFPITSGKHANLACTQCHPAQKPWKQFSCTGCMDHSKARMDAKHLGEVSGYSWTSAACYSCHPKGVAEDD